MITQSRISGADSVNAPRAVARPEPVNPDFGEIRLPALKGVIAGSAAARAARKPQADENVRELPPILRKAAFED